MSREPSRGRARRDDRRAFADRKAQHDRVRALTKAGDYAQALPASERLVRAHASWAEAWSLRAAVLFSAQQFTEALAAADKALDLAPTHALALNNRACALVALDRPAEAMTAARLALDVPDGAALRDLLMNTLGNAAMRLGQLDEANDYYLAALTGNPRALPDVLGNIGKLRLEQGRFEAASDMLQLSLSLQPDMLALEAYGQARIGCALNHATPDAELAHAWDHYRLGFERFPRWVRERLWRGEALAGKTILVTHMLGVGDEIMLTACLQDLVAPQMLADGVRTILACDPRLVGLLQRSFPSITVRPGIANGVRRDTRQAITPELVAGIEAELGRAVDYIAPINLLPAFTRRTFASFRTVPWLVPAPELVAKWRAWLEVNAPGKRVGVAWRSSARGGLRDKFYPALMELAPLAGIEGATLVSLDYSDGAAELAQAAAHGLPIVVPPLDQFAELEEVAALVSCLDAVATHGGTPAAIAGALGVPTWYATPQPAWWQLGLRSRDLWLGAQVRYQQNGAWPFALIAREIAAQLAA